MGSLTRQSCVVIAVALLQACAWDAEPPKPVMHAQAEQTEEAPASVDAYIRQSRHWAPDTYLIEFKRPWTKPSVLGQDPRCQARLP